MGKLKVRLENQIVYTMPFRILQKIWDIAWDDAIFFIFFLVCGHLAALFAVQVSFPDEENLWLTEQDFQPDSLCNWNASVIVEYNCLKLSWFLKLHRGENSLQTRKLVVTIAILCLTGVMKIRKQRAGTRNLSLQGPSCTSLRRRRNLTSFCNVCEAVPRSLFWAPNGFNELPEVRFEFPFILPDRQIDNGFFNRPIMACSNPGTQVGPRTRISALFRRRT